MESTMPANATVSAVIRAGRFMSFFFSFRSCVAIAHPQNHASGSGREKSEPGWPNCTPTAVKPTVFSYQTDLSSSDNSRRHQSDSIDPNHKTKNEHNHQKSDAERVVAFQKHNPLGT